MKEIEATRLKLAAMEMVEGTELKWWEAIKFHACPTETVFFQETPLFLYPLANYELALNIIEGKPVWAGDTVWLGEKSGVVQADGGVKMNEGGYAWHLRNRPYSWLPPKPKTAMVELLVENGGVAGGGY